MPPEGLDDVALLLESNSHPAARMFQEALFMDGIAATAFAVEDLPCEYERLTVVFTMPPTAMETMVQAVFDDTCGNLMQIYQAASLLLTVRMRNWP